MTLPLHPENCQCEYCQNEQAIIDDLVSVFVELGGSSLGPKMHIPEDDDPYYDIFLTKEELDRKYP